MSDEPHPLDGVFASVARAGVRRWRVVLVLSLAMVVLSPFLLRGLRIETASASFIAADDEVSRIYRESLARFGESDPLVIQVLPGSGRREVVDALTDHLVESVSGWPDVAWVEARPDSFLEGDRAVAMARAALLNSDAETARELAEAVSREAINRRIRRTRKLIVLAESPADRNRLAADPLDVQSLILPFFRARAPHLQFASTSSYYDSPDGRSRLVFVQPTGSGEDTAYCVELLERLNGAVAGARRVVPGSDGVQCRFTGKHALTGESASALARDMFRITLFAFGLVLLLLLVVFEDRRAAIVCIVPILVSFVPVLIFARLFFNPLNFLAVGFAAIILGLGVDAMLHCTGRLFQIASQGDLGLEETVARTLTDCGPPVTIGVLTTAGAFLSLWFADYRALSQFGLLTAAGLVISLIVSLGVFPAVVRWVRPGAVRAAGGLRIVDRPTRLFRTWWRRPVAVIAGSAVLILAAAIIARGFEFDHEFSSLLPRGTEAVDAAHGISSSHGASFLLNTQLVLQAETLEAALAFQRIVDAALEEMAKDGGIAAFVSPTQYLASQTPGLGHEAVLRLAAAELSANREFFFERLESAGFSEPRAYATYLDGLERVVSPPREDRERDPDGLLDDPQVRRTVSRNEDGTVLQTSVWPIHGTSASATARLVSARIEALDVPDGAALHVTGTDRLYEHLHEVVGSNFVRVGLISGGFVVALLFAFFRSPGVVVLGLVPIVSAVPVTFAMVVVTGIPFSPLGIGVTAMVIGIGIDDAVHILRRVQRAPERGIRAVMTEIGPIITLTSLSSIIGFGALGFAGHPVVSSLGIVVAFGVLACWFFSMVTLPALWRVRERLHRPRGRVAAWVVGLLAAGCGVAHADDLDQVLQKIERNFDSAQAYSCRIEQTKTIRQLEGEIKLGGTLVFKKPHFLWLHLEGDENLDLTCDGDEITIVDHDLGETETFAFDPSMGTGRLARIMPPVLWLPPDEMRAACDIRAVEDPEFATGLVFEPAPGSEFSFLDLVVGLDRRGRIKRVRTRYANGDVTTSEFSEWKRIKDIDESVFQPRQPAP